MDAVLKDAAASAGSGTLVALVVIGLVTIVTQVVPTVFSFLWMYVLRPGSSWSKYKGEWAVVTGASTGIGAGFARALASRGMNVVLMARSEEKLRALASELEYKSRVSTLAIPFDFAAAGPDQYSALKTQLDGKTVSVLVNNVGVNVDFPHSFLDTPEPDQDRMIQVNISATMAMTRLLAAPMADRKRGCIYFLSSAGGTWLPSPMLSVYGGTKAFMDSFAVALAGELTPRGVSVHSAVPFHVKTAMAKVKKSVTAPMPDDFARKCVDQMGLQIRLNPHWAHAVVRGVVGLVPLEMATKMVQDSQVATRARALKKRAAAQKAQ